MMQKKVERVKSMLEDSGRLWTAALAVQASDGVYVPCAVVLGPDVVAAGWVWKKSRHLRQWRRRWLVLTESQLATYKEPRDAKPTEAINADNFQATEAPTEQDRAGSLTVLTADRLRVEFECEDPRLRNELV